VHALTLQHHFEPIYSFPCSFCIGGTSLDARFGFGTKFTKKSNKKIQQVQHKHDEGIAPHHLFEMMSILHIKTLLATQRR